MMMAESRERVVAFGRKLVTSGLTTGTGGNLSVLDPEADLVAVTPSGIDYDELTPEDVVVTDRHGVVVEGGLSPSSELGFHLALYNYRPDIGAVVHTHSPWATTMACLGWELPAVHYLVGFAGHKVPLASYATFGTRELADRLVAAIGTYNAVLLANHGLVTVGRTLPSAFAAAEEIEFVARVYLQAKSVGEPVVLSQREMEVVMEKFMTYGQKGKR